MRLRQDFLDATELKIAEKYVRERNTRLANPDKSEVVKSSTRGQFLREPGLTKSPASPATWTDALCNHIWGELEERISACVAKNGSKYELPSHPYREQYGKNPNNGGMCVAVSTVPSQGKDCGSCHVALPGSAWYSIHTLVCGLV